MNPITLTTTSAAPSEIPQPKDEESGRYSLSLVFQTSLTIYPSTSTCLRLHHHVAEAFTGATHPTHTAVYTTRA